MTALTAAELSAIRSAISNLLPDSNGVILTPTVTPDGMGGYSESWGTATSGLSYRIDPLRGIEKDDSGALNPYQGWTLTLPHDTTITTTHRFKDSSGNQYAVISVDTKKSWKSSVRVRLEAL